ncbi:MAG: hypothetical protein HC867_03090 [Bacteroidia bacterium]|nr:hypothetical protein [Bacteroidia bacterium]
MIKRAIHMTESCRIILFICILVQPLAGFSQQDTLLHFNFESATGNLVVDKISGKKFPVETTRKNIEIVPAAIGNGLRTDGYSTYVSASISTEPKVELTATGWFAFETYPTDTAGLLTLKNKSGTEWVSAGVNQFGFPVLIYSRNGKAEFLTGSSPIKNYMVAHWFSLRQNIC